MEKKPTAGSRDASEGSGPEPLSSLWWQKPLEAVSMDTPINPFAHLFVAGARSPTSREDPEHPTTPEGTAPMGISSVGPRGSAVPPEEAILLDLLRAEEPVLAELAQGKLRLAQRMVELIDGDLRECLVVSKVLHEVSLVAGVIGKRQQSVALAHASLRAQRRLLELRDGD